MQNLCKDDIRIVCVEKIEMEDRTEQRTEDKTEARNEDIEKLMSLWMWFWTIPKSSKEMNHLGQQDQLIMCTFNTQTAPLQHAEEDGNGAYIQTGCLKKLYHKSNKGVWSCTVAKSNEHRYYINRRLGRKYEKIPAPPNEVYLLTRV